MLTITCCLPNFSSIFNRNSKTSWYCKFWDSDSPFYSSCKTMWSERIILIIKSTTFGDNNIFRNIFWFEPYDHTTIFWKMQLNVLVLLLHQPNTIFFKINNWLYIKFETLNGGTFFPNISYFAYEFIIRNFNIMLSFISKN